MVVIWQRPRYSTATISYAATMPMQCQQQMPEMKAVYRQSGERQFGRVSDNDEILTGGVPLAD